MADVLINFGGWNSISQGWGQGGWGQSYNNLFVNGTTLALGDEVVTISVAPLLVGQAATGGLSSVPLITENIFGVTGQQVTGEFGLISLVTENILSVAGQVGTGAVGTTVIAAAANVLPTGVVAISGFSSIALVTDNNLAVTGLAATGSTETVLVWQVITPSDNNPGYTPIHT